MGRALDGPKPPQGSACAAGAGGAAHERLPTPPDLLLLLYCARNVAEKEVPQAQLSRCLPPPSSSPALCHPTQPQPRSSNVVEKCLKLGGAGLNEQRDAVVEELMQSPNLSRLLQVRPWLPCALLRKVERCCCPQGLLLYQLAGPWEGDAAVLVEAHQEGQGAVHQLVQGGGARIWALAGLGHPLALGGRHGRAAGAGEREGQGAELPM